MKYRPAKRIIWLLIPLLPLLLMFIGVWAAENLESQARATRGAAPPKPKSFVVASPSTWPTAFAIPYDWYDEGMDAVMNWNFNPWRNNSRSSNSFGERFRSLRRSKDPKDQAEYQELMRQGEEWFQRILARYPELAASYKPVPDDRNALLRLRNLENRLRRSGPNGEDFNFNLPEGFAGAPNQPDGNLGEAKTWLDANRSLVDEIRAIGLMPDRSSADLPPLNSESMWGSTFANILLMDARAAAANGDLSSAAESVRAATGLADHLKNSDAPTFLDSLVGSLIQQRVQSYVITNILPSIPAGQVDLSLWEKALNPPLQQPADFSLIVKSEWSSTMRNYLLPSLADTANSSNPNDSEALTEAYTQHMLALARQNESLALTDLPANPSTKSDVSDFSKRSRQVAADRLFMTEGTFDMQEIWEYFQTDVGPSQAASAILKGQPIPNDPIYGKPYVWDPVTRQLSLPSGPEFDKNRSRSRSSITVPKL